MQLILVLILVGGDLLEASQNVGDAPNEVGGNIPIEVGGGVEERAGDKCDEKELESVKKKWRDCRWRYLDEFADARDTFTREEYLQSLSCLLVTNTVEKCSALWQNCLSSRDVRSMKQLLLQSLLDSHAQEMDVDRCEVVDKYGEVEKQCDEQQSLAAQRRLQQCSQQMSSRTYNSIRGLKNVDLVTNKFCSTLKEIGEVCIKNLQDCFTKEDVHQHRNSHLQNMKQFLIRISNQKLASDGLDHCDVLKHLEKEDESVVVKMINGEAIENNRFIVTETQTAHPEAVTKLAKVTTDSFTWNFVNGTDISNTYAGDLDSGKMVLVKSGVKKDTPKSSVREVGQTSTNKDSSIPTTSRPSFFLEVAELSSPSSGSSTSAAASILVILMSLTFLSLMVGLLAQAALNTCCSKYHQLPQ